MYSLTKYINGHSDVIMGAAITRRDDIEEILRFHRNGNLIESNKFVLKIFFKRLNYYFFQLWELFPLPSIAHWSIEV